MNDIREAAFYSVFADELSSHHVEHLPLSLRFVDKKCNIREDCIGFEMLDEIRVSDITTAIVSTLKRLGLSLNYLCG